MVFYMPLDTAYNANKLIDTLSPHIKIDQIAPDLILNTNIFTNSVKNIELDYRTGLESGLNYIFSLNKEKENSKIHIKK